MGGQLTVSARALLSVPLVASLCLVTACSAPFWRDSVYFTPPEARVFETATVSELKSHGGACSVSICIRVRNTKQGIFHLISIQWQYFVAKSAKMPPER